MATDDSNSDPIWDADPDEKPTSDSAPTVVRPSTHRRLNPGDLVAGKYRVVREIGAGGMGVVYLARHEDLKIDVAIKTSTVGSLRQAQAAARLKHRGIVEVHDVIQADGQWLMVMEYVPGKDLASIISSQRDQMPAGLPSSEQIKHACRLVSEVAEALQHAHDHQIIHRDIKPHNILLDAAGHPRIVDFGLAKDLAARSISKPGDLAGTPSYMSPEQALAKRIKIDHRTDVYSLGVVLYELLALKRPFDGDTYHDILYQISFTMPPGLRKVNPQIPRDLEVICATAMAKSPDDRYADAGSLAEDLRRFLNHESIRARPPKPWKIVTLWARRHRAAVLVCITLIFAALAIGFWVRSQSAMAAQMTRIAVTTDHPDDQIWLRRYDPETWKMGEPVRLSKTGGLVEPGQYRISVLRNDTDDTFAEIDTEVLVAGEMYTYTPPLHATPDVTADMVLIPAGPFIFGHEDNPRTIEQQRTITLPAFYVDRYEVSNAKYQAFLDATGAAPPRHWPASPADYAALPDDWGDRPVVRIPSPAMHAYAQWAGKRLLTAFEWERCARGTDGRTWPWGNGPPPGGWRDTTEHFAEFYRAGSFQHYLDFSRPVDSDPELASPDGIFHMFGNVCEITATMDANGDVIFKGGAWYNDPRYKHLGFTSSRPPFSGDTDTGFRCARSVNPIAQLDKE